MLEQLQALPGQLGRDAAHERVEGGEGEGMILSVGGGTSPGMPRENIVAMLETPQEYNAGRLVGQGATHG